MKKIAKQPLLAWKCGINKLGANFTDASKYKNVAHVFHKYLTTCPELFCQGKSFGNKFGPKLVFRLITLFLVSVPSILSSYFSVWFKKYVDVYVLVLTSQPD